nr:unnamed protein product [Callosobruchus chinensis]CAI5822070.1 unnamed protein product [Callosobruchus analis]CAI5829872.1 unnamed protein product [Callosobruchus analis]
MDFLHVEAFHKHIAVLFHISQQHGQFAGT